MKSTIKNKVIQEQGFTLLEIVFVLAILLSITTAAFAHYSNSTKVATVKSASLKARHFQQGVETYFDLFQKVPTDEELYNTTLTGQNDLGFTVMSSIEFWDKCESDGKTPLLSTGDPVHPWTEKFEMPRDWIILSKEKNLKEGAYIYAVDGKEPVWVAFGNRPFSLDEALEKRPGILQDMAY